MTSRTGFALVAVLTFLAIPACAQKAASTLAPVVSFCDVVANPGAYDGKVISIPAKVSHEFEDFTLFDTHCSEKPDIWIELGGDLQCKYKWDAMEFSCDPGRNVKFRGVEYPVVKDAGLETFLKLVRERQNKKPVNRVTATLTGTFFGENPKQDKGLRSTLPGYGHMGCCFQLIVGQVSAVSSSKETQDRDDEWKQRLSRPIRKGP